MKIGAIEFKSKTAAKEYCRSILYRYGEGHHIAESDEMFLRSLLALHPEYHQKLGSGIDHFTVRTDPVWKTTQHFVLVRTDGTSTDFSFHTCIDGSNHRKDVLQALRHAVSDQVLNFSRCSFATQDEIFCPYTGDQLSPLDCHIDHTPPDTFLNLVNRWMKESSISYNDIKLVDNADNQCVCELKDTEISSSWQRFHIVNCNLRLVSPVANLSHVIREANL